ncbi:hypothetical protein MPSEU_000278900 [Mayamaea pseudoterrestris]|nr:hypothetical protein MPSEU_000278900 [Mayamaea pseudoterrestris]
MSFFQRFSADASNACSDLYANWFLGDDAGKSIRLTLILRPQSLPVKKKGPVRIDLGMTFIEINGRAYVKSVAPNSAAAQSGVMPQDCVQYACVFRPEWVSDISQESEADSSATQHVLALEDKGLRISYDELRKLLAEAIDPTQSAFLSPSQSQHPWTGPPIPSTVNICVPMDVASEEEANDPYRGEMPRPVVFCLRRTRQRQSIHHIPGIPSFRMDDEIDFAALLVKRLAPTPDMEILPPDTWEELVHDGTDWLLGRGSILPPKSSMQNPRVDCQNENDDDLPSRIPLDDFEKIRAQKLSSLRSRMAAEAMQLDRSADVEAVTIRGMIQKAMGLAFVRASKIVLGVSMHFGSGIVIARLSDGTWSAPSAIGTCGVGLGLQFGLEVCEYIFILQTQEALDHFKRGGSFTVGGNMGVAFAGVGREAYGAASLDGACGSLQDVRDDEYNDNDSRVEQTPPKPLGIAPIVAYAKSQGLYVGVSLEGSRIYARDDINRRAYKFISNRDVTSSDILAGKVATPGDAEILYAALHSVEFMHEMSCLPRPPEVLRRDSANSWRYNRPMTTGQAGTPLDPLNEDLFAFVPSLNAEDAEECEHFELSFKNFMYGGVSVQRLIPDEERSGKAGKERRTLWLMLPEVGSLRLGYVSKLSDGDGVVSNKSSTQRARRDDFHRQPNFDGEVGTVGSEDVTLDSAIHTRQDGSMIGITGAGNVHLSNRHSVALTDVIVLSQEPLVPIKFNGEDKTEHLRVISMQDVAGTSLLFLANNFREAELLVCGLKLLLERETARLGIRGGLPRSSGLTPNLTRSYADMSVSAGGTNFLASDYGGDESTMGESVNKHDRTLPIGRPTWGNVPGRNYMRGQAAAASTSPHSGKRLEMGIPSYGHGQEMVRDVARNVQLPLPLPLCRVLLLDSTSPIIRKWEEDRGDFNFEKSRWTFPPATPRELERHTSEHQLIASGSMCGASRTTSFDRPRYGSIVRLSETQAVDADDSSKLVFSVTERNPRRGFSVKVKVTLKAKNNNTCDATVVAEIRPVGKDMSNQAAVHKALLLVLDEITQRYGAGGTGLVSGFLTVVDQMTETDNASKSEIVPRPFHRTDPATEEKKIDATKSGHHLTGSARDASRKHESRQVKSGLVSFEDMLKTAGTGSLSPLPNDRLATPGFAQITDLVSQPNRIADRRTHDRTGVHHQSAAQSELERQRLIEVKPLPKIRLSLMPSPREEDEDDNSSASPKPSGLVRKTKKKSSAFRSSPKHNTISSPQQPPTSPTASAERQRGLV